MRITRQSIHRALRVIAYGGPKRLCDNATWARTHPEAWTKVIDREVPNRRPAVKFGTIDADFESMLPAAFPEMGLVTLAHGRIIGPHGWLVSADGSLLHENSWYGAEYPTKPWKIAYGKRRAVKGTCLSLASDFAIGNYGHFILDCLGRAALFLKAGRSFGEIDHVYIPRPPSPTTEAFLRAIGVPLEKCIWAEESCIAADTVIGTTFPGTRRNYPRWLIDFFRSLAGTDAKRAHRRIYVPRTGPRQVRNEAELRAALDRFGFETYDFRKVDDEAAYFAEAEIVVGAHGAGMTNLIFCQPGTWVLELLPSDHVWPYFYTIADSAGAAYHYIVGNSLGSRPKGTFGPSPFDFVVDPAVFESALETICSDVPGARSTMRLEQS
ncbi:glycosyltransferase family 61 protein [Dongia sedimenti]|uniref:Glycosyltransferase family 61 protein n=1 Tax=Dongia sedimenti TaxID=3064282 RepID=A0ABU0YSV4_9PROT|nr:glycosyltransferase family 61 protein [Rhodospirillaceae bacterium R-7]